MYKRKDIKTTHNIHKILIVEDDPVIRDLLFSFLKTAGDNYLVKVAGDGFIAGQMIEKFRPDLLILDIFLPSIDGFRICKELKGNYPDIKIAVITGQDSDKTRKKIIKSGADRYFIKPVDMRELLESVRELLAE